MRLCRLLVRGAICVRLSSFGLGHAIPFFVCERKSRYAGVILILTSLQKNLLT
jgi:hypothetical protein